VSDWIWLNPTVVRAIHDEQLTEHGGAPGTRDEGMLESPLARPRHLTAYGKPDAAAGDLSKDDFAAWIRTHAAPR
jgi:death-on-curing protein